MPLTSDSNVWPIIIMITLCSNLPKAILKRLIEPYRNEFAVTSKTTKIKMLNFLKRKGHSFQAILCDFHDDWTKTNNIYLLPLKIYIDETNDTKPTFKTFLTNLKNNTKEYLSKYSNKLNFNTEASEIFKSSSDLVSKNLIKEFLESPACFSRFLIHKILSDPKVTFDSSPNDDDDFFEKFAESMNLTMNDPFDPGYYDWAENLTLPEFTHLDSSDCWIQKCFVLLTMCGARDERKIIAFLLSKLPEDIQDIIITEMGDNLMTTVKELARALRNCTKVDQGVVTQHLNELKYDPDTYGNMRRYFYKIKNLVIKIFPKMDEANVLRYSIAQFRIKVPVCVQDDPVFNTTPFTGDPYEIIELAQNIYDRITFYQRENLNNLTECFDGQGHCENFENDIQEDYQGSSVESSEE